MVRGNWQRRVERTEALRSARKLQQHRRRSKRRSTSIGGDTDRESSYRLLEEWMEDKAGNILLDSYGGEVTLDVWTDVRPARRREYLQLDESKPGFVDDEEEEGRNRSKKKDRGGFQKKGKLHPNAKNKVDKGPMMSSSTPKEEKNPLLCPQEFYFGREKCPAASAKQKRGGGRGRSNSIGDEEVSCHLCHYHQFPKVKNTTKSSWVVSNTVGQNTAPLTLAQVVNGKFMQHKLLNERIPVAMPVHVREAVLQWAFDAAVTSNGLVDNNDDVVGESVKGGSLGMMYHSRVYVQSDEVDDDNNGNEGSDDNSANEEDGSHEDSEDDSEDDMENYAVLQSLQQLLDDETLSPVNVIYVSIQGVLLYDAFRGGLLHSDATERYLLHGESFDANFGKPNEIINDGSKCLHEQLTHHILEDILSFLNDESTAVLPQVCRAWRDEVGTRSPQLWKMLLMRRNWLSTADTNGENTTTDPHGEVMTNECRHYKEAFISHYLAVRDVQAISNACNVLQSGGGGGGRNAKQKDGIEYAVQSFKATKGSPIFDSSNDRGRCTVKVWPSYKNPRALAAYSGDCTLRLFEAVQGSASGRMICRQIVCVRASPPSVSRKKNKCELVAMDLDDSVVACLVNEINDASDADDDIFEADALITPWITVIPCEELICAGNEGILGEECLHSFDVRASILDYIMGGSSDNANIADLREEIFRFLSVVDNGTSDVLISVTPQLVACGKGNYLFHASISIPGYSLMPNMPPEDFEESELEMFGAAATIVFPSSEDMLFVISTQRGGAIIRSKRMLDGCDGLFASRPFRRRLHENEPPALCTNLVIQSGNTLKLHRLILGRDGIPNIENLYVMSGEADENACVDVTATHVLYGTRQNGAVVNILEIESRNVWSTPRLQDASLQNMKLIHDEYLMAIFRSQNPAGDEEDEAIDGHWFGPADTSLRAFVYHIPSRRCMHECPIPNLQLSFDSHDDVIAASASTLGFVIAGKSARKVARETDDADRLNEEAVLCPNGKNPKGKKKRLAAKTAKKDKKDGFARGMSMRG
ncbi:hypothetical protein ACHAXN_005631 [Cyclotella atomus]